MNSIYLLQFVFCLLFSSGGMITSAFAQQQGQFVDNSQLVEIPFTITNYNTRHGIPQNQIEDIYAKKNGELILATANGIVSYDGNSFTNFIKNTKYKKTLHTRLLYSEKYQKLYGMELSGNFNQIDPVSKRVNCFTAACMYKEKIYGVFKSGSIAVFDPKDNTTKKLISTTIRGAGAIHFDGKQFTVSGINGTYRINHKSKETKKITTLGFSRIKENQFTHDLYLLDLNKVYKLGTTNKAISVVPKGDFNDFKFHDITFTKDDEIYIASNRGLIYIGYGYSELYDRSTFLPSENIRSLSYSLSENCIFAGTGNKGLLKLQIKNCASLMQFQDLSNSAISSIIQTRSGEILAASNIGTIFKIGVENTLPYFVSPNSPSSLAEIGDEIWVGTWGQGIHRFKNRKYIGDIAIPQLKNNIVHSAFKDSRGMIWIGTSWGLSAGKDAKSIRPVLRKEVPGQIITIYERKNGNLLLGGKYGLEEIDKNNKPIRHWGEKEGLKCKEVRSIYEDSQRKIWLGTYDGGLYCIEKGKVTSINSMPNCMLNEDVFTIARDHSGNIYMSSNNGLWVVSEKSLNAFYRKKIPYLIPLLYGNEAGILNTEFNGGFQNNFAHTSYDHFYFPSIEGIVTVSPDELKPRKLTPSIKWVKVNNELVNIKNAAYERSARTVEFNFHAANFCPKFNVYYQYKLDGPESSNQWEEMQKSGNVLFSFLPPGEYTLRVRALDGLNDPSPKVVTYHFKIKPYFYETWWFRIFALLFILSKTTLFIHYRIKVRRKKELKANTISNNILELKLKAIQAKMNPHFIFNTLNNIQYLIVLDRKEDAEKALHEFAILLRKFLNQSDNSFVPLQEELSIIEKYLQLEQIQFDGEMEVIFETTELCGKRVIPTLLLQPVVENAIKHGLAHSSINKKLLISAICDENSLSVSIDDNGIGREASKKINNYRESHVSHGWKLVIDKIEMIFQKYEIAVRYEIIDKVAPETGTKVTFIVPLIDEELLKV